MVTCGTCGHRWHLWSLVAPVVTGGACGHRRYLWYLWSPQVTQVPPMTTCTTGTTSTTGATGTTGGEQLCVLQTTDPRRPPPHHRFPPELLPQTTARATHMPYPRRISGGLARVPRSPARPHGDHRSTPRPPSCGPHAMRRHGIQHTARPPCFPPRKHGFGRLSPCFGRAAHVLGP